LEDGAIAESWRSANAGGTKLASTAKHTKKLVMLEDTTDLLAAMQQSGALRFGGRQ
jgi:hypothetical protein